MLLARSSPPGARLRRALLINRKAAEAVGESTRRLPQPEAPDTIPPETLMDIMELGAIGELVETAT